MKYFEFGQEHSEFMVMPAYLALGAWVLPQSPVCGALMLAGGILFLLPGVAHHVFCGAVE